MTGEVREVLRMMEADFGDDVSLINREIESFATARKAAEDEARDLVIAIVGRVKSGKSSFLNALLFRGDNVLPQAATPMTAALTFIRYDETCHAEVEFFTKANWDDFQNKAKAYHNAYEEAKVYLEKIEDEEEKKAKRFFRKYQRREITEARINERLRASIGEETLAAVELVKMASAGQKGDEIGGFLGTTQRIDGATPQELSEKLRDYVGAKGRFTPIVCSTTIYLNDPGLKGYCVIDTPGTNDPVISRGKKTQDNLKKADVVLVMSPAGRFFDDSDLRLCGQNLPANGVKDFLILISQFDLSIGEVENKIDRGLSPLERLQKAMMMSRGDLVTRYRDCISAIAQRAKKNNNADVEKWERLLNQSPILVSAKAYILARHWDSLDEKEKEYLKGFNALIPGFTFTRDVLDEFSMMGSVETRLENVKDKKKQILNDRRKALSERENETICELISDLRSKVVERIDLLASNDLAKLEANLEDQTKILEKSRISLEDIFEDAVHAAHDKFNAILNEVREARSRYLHLAVETETTEGCSTKYVNRGGLGILDYLCGPKQVREYYTITTRYADAYQAVDQVQAFADRARKSLEDGIRSSIDIKALQKKVVNTAFDLFETSRGEDLDVDLLRGQVKRSVREVTIPDADFGDVDYTSLITSSFGGGRVEDAAIELLKSAQREALQNVVSDLELRTKEKASAIEHSLKRAMTTFVDGLIVGIRKECEQLSASVKDKERVLARWKGYLSVLDGCLK